MRAPGARGLRLGVRVPTRRGRRARQGVGRPARRLGAEALPGGIPLHAGAFPPGGCTARPWPCGRAGPGSWRPGDASPAPPAAGVSNMIARLAKTCTLRISPSRLNFILADRVAHGGVSMWCELEQENFFSEFQMEGVSAESNAIYLELISENLSRALKTAQNARALKIKLTNKHFPCLTVSIELLSVSNSSRIVTHDIPIKVIPRKLWKDLQEPTVPDSDVSIYLPLLKTMKSVVEKMKNISNHLIIEANLNGDLNLKIESELVCVTTHFKDLGNPPVAWEDASQDRNPARMVEVHVDIRKFLQFLSGQQVNPTKAVCRPHV
ncbi:PREDICTED: checkpoint protein HUS1 isoform X3 [Hipposideros armiger]|uniref:Checkpoint protein HUS1 n=1 Tax=Hipposideros armiger TaxID=186990 RepID=A0A8B7S6F7_HIPAR|nr:PREDICTED: checkpoint protein HUS1 isoform X3 [Hipposideros armiger]